MLLLQARCRDRAAHRGSHEAGLALAGHSAGATSVALPPSSAVCALSLFIDAARLRSGFRAPWRTTAGSAANPAFLTRSSEWRSAGLICWPFPHAASTSSPPLRYSPIAALFYDP